jgi:hypothetical protein
MKIQLNITATVIDSHLIGDQDVAKAMKLGKNQGVGLDLEALVRKALDDGAFKVQVCRRSANKNLTVTLPVKAEATLVAMDLTAKAKTDEEKATALRAALGL